MLRRLLMDEWGSTFRGRRFISHVPAVVLVVLALFAAGCSTPRNEAAQNLLAEVTTLDDGVFSEPQLMNPAFPCRPWLIPVAPFLTDGTPTQQAEADSVLDAIVVAEATAFERAGWTVTRYSGSGDSFKGLAMVAELENDAVVLTRFLGADTLAYRFVADCGADYHPADVFEIDSFM